MRLVHWLRRVGVSTDAQTRAQHDRAEVTADCRHNDGATGRMPRERNC